MFQRTLILAGISAAYAQFISIDPCQRITSALQTAFRSDDPHTFPSISDFIYIRENQRYNFDFTNLMFKGFSNVYCSYFNHDEPHLTTMNLTGQNLGFLTNHFKVKFNQGDFANQHENNFNSKLRDYTLELNFDRYYYTLEPYFTLCITSESLNMTLHAERIRTDIGSNPLLAQELNDHPEAVVEAINNYLPRFANDLTSKLNDILCYVHVVAFRSESEGIFDYP
ncbi:uncharacterized protein [Palaemon carinicauda]|uniref:uncharacterized protein n=1 Tax=Palaemon carinicauda TaxID=392227 RepID=UPI0035B69D4B